MNRRIHVFGFLAAVVLCSAAAVGVRGQEPPATFRLDTVEVVVRVRGEGKWIQGAVAEQAVRPDEGGSDARVRRVRPVARPDRSPLLFIAIGRTEYQVGTDSLLRLFNVRLRPWYQYTRFDEPEARGLANAFRFRRTAGHPHLRLPSSQLWELIVPRPPAPLAPGTAWVDTLDFAAVPVPGHREELRGVWSQRVRGDTVLDGRRLPLIESEARVTFRETWPVSDAAFDDPMDIERRAEGTVRGWFVLDTLVGVRRAGADTIRLTGEATLTLQDGRTFTEPARFTGTRTWAPVDSAADAAASEQRRKQMGGMLFAPREPEPIAPGRTLEDVWSEAVADPDPIARQLAMQRLARLTERRWDDLANELARRALAAGDTATWLERYAGGSFARQRPRLDLEEWERIAPFLHDPGRVWHFGIEPKWIYTGLARDLLRIGPVAGRPDSTWACPPDACPAIIAEMMASDEPRLRDLGLIGSFAYDPARWADSVVARREAGHALLEETAWMARGTGSIWPASDKSPVPGEGAGWRSWLDWMGGGIRLDETHDLALRYNRAVTGRDALADLESRWQALADDEGEAADSARLVVGSILRRFDRLPPPSPGEVHRELISGNASRIAAARRELDGLGLLQEPERLTGPDALTLLAPVLDSMLARGRRPWPSVSGGESARNVSVGQGFHGSHDVQVFVDDDGAPPSLEDGRSVTRISGTGFQARDRRAGGVIVDFAPVMRWGDIVRLSWSWTAWFPRAEDEAPEGYAGGQTLWLVRIEGGWAVAHWSGWIT